MPLYRQISEEEYLENESRYKGVAIFCEESFKTSDMSSIGPFYLIPKDILDSFIKRQAVSFAGKTITFGSTDADLKGVVVGYSETDLIVALSEQKDIGWPSTMLEYDDILFDCYKGKEFSQLWYVKINEITGVLAEE